MRRAVMAAWLVLVACGAWGLTFARAGVEVRIHGALGGPIVLAGFVYLLLGAVRGFTLIPSTYLVVAAVAFFPPVPLFLLTVAGIAASSTGIYFFAEALRLHEIVERRHTRQVARLRDLLGRHELPIIIGWSFFPLAPTDLIVYVCGALRIHFGKCLLGVCLGEGAICGIYIFLGDYLLRVLHVRPIG